ncbi:hypothetical protein R6Q57_009287 [Mikania cordata]
MEESQEILLQSLAKVGVPIPPEVLSVQDLTPESLVSICAHSLHILSNIPITLPESMADRFKVCTDLASFVKDLGYIGDMSFHKFLYPSEEDTYKLIRFLVGRLSESSQTAVTSEAKDNINNLETSIDNEEQDLHTNVELLKLTTDGQHNLEQSTMSLQDKSSQMENSINQEDAFSESKSLMLQQLEEQHDLLKAAIEMVSDEQIPLQTYIIQLSKQIDAKRHNLAEMESKWKGIIKPLQEKKRHCEEVLCAKHPDTHEKHQHLKQLEQELESTLSEMNQREMELSNLSAEVKKLPKLATRRSYIERIKEITKNSRKQDIDIERILKDTRDLQLESNMIQERLHRTYAVVDETLLREAKKDQVGEQAHVLLTTIHESFEEISEKILATDRTRREETDLETKLSSIASRGLNLGKLQADLDAIKKENEYIESCLGNPKEPL